MGLLTNNIKQYEDEENSLKQKQLELNEKINTLKSKEDIAHQKKINCTLKTYLNNDTRQNLIDQAVQLKYSDEKTKKLKDLFSDWKQDNITEEAICLILEAESFVDFFNNKNNKKRENSQKKNNIINVLANYFIDDRGDDNVN